MGGDLSAEAAAARQMKSWCKQVALAAAFAGLCQTTAANAASRNVGSGLIGNTVELTGPAGKTSIYYVNRDDLIVHMPDGKKVRGWWRVKGRSICTKMGNKPENCTDPIDEPPVAGSSGVLTGPGGDIRWAVIEGRAF
jgi:hypothetical protein